ncbi:hypothetical protein [Kribbella catacumbae]|uniref:hypothetical protein n=1 Tax=Kribbella catacumbae TaxID=460086 RepID=UPI00037F27C0|nr:hypothetical protein [Kribbella catacumbae]
MRTWIWRLHTISSAVMAVFIVLLLIIVQHTRGAECDPGTACNPHGFLTIFVVFAGVVLAGPCLVACFLSRVRSESGPGLGLLASILLLGFTADGIHGSPGWLTVLTWVLGGWFLILSVAGLALFRSARPGVD